MHTRSLTNEKVQRIRGCVIHMNMTQYKDGFTQNIQVTSTIFLLVPYFSFSCMAWELQLYILPPWMYHTLLLLSLLSPFVHTNSTLPLFPTVLPRAGDQTEISFSRPYRRRSGRYCCQSASAQKECEKKASYRKPTCHCRLGNWYRIRAVCRLPCR